jgi:SAM-dependent methyltransferase
MGLRDFRVSTRAAAADARSESRGMRARTVRWGAALAALCFAGLAAAQQPSSRNDCERSYKPSSGQSGKDVIWVPTPDTVVNRMLALAKVTPQDTVVDLGAGDGKIAIAAGKLGANALGIEFNPDMVRLANCLAQVEGAPGKTRIIHGDIFKEDFSKADVLTMYLLPELNLCVRHRILAMRPGTRVTAHQFNMRDWDPDETADVEGRDVHLWMVPARVAGTWVLRNPNGLNATVNLVQSFQKIGGEIIQGKQRHPLLGATLRGDEIRFAFNDEKGVTHRFNGKVSGQQLSGYLFSNEGGETEVTGTMQGQPRLGNWAAMVPQCSRFYS